MQLPIAIIIILLQLGSSNIHAAILPLTIIPRDDFAASYVEFQPNGTVTLQGAVVNHEENKQNLLLLRSILRTLRLATPLAVRGEGKLNIKIYGEGVEHKFPPLLENLIQRIQNYFSIYRYTDTSRPLRTTTLRANELPEGELVVMDEELGTTTGISVTSATTATTGTSVTSATTATTAASSTTVSPAITGTIAITTTTATTKTTATTGTTGTSGTSATTATTATTGTNVTSATTATTATNASTATTATNVITVTTETTTTTITSVNHGED